MPRPTPENSPRVANLAKAGEIASTVGAVLSCGIPVYLIGSLVTGSPIIDDVLTEGFELTSPVGELGLFQRAVALLLWLLPIFLGLAMLVIARNLFAGFRRSGVFTQNATRQLRHIGWLLVATFPVRLISEGFGTLVASLANDPGNRLFSLSLGDADVYAIVVGLTIVVVSHIHGEAIQLAEENRAFV